MNLSDSPAPLFKAGWLRAVLYIVALVIALVIVLLSFILGLHKANPDMSRIVELFTGNQAAVLAVILFALTVAITYVFRRWIDRKSFISLGLGVEGHIREAISGGSLAIFILGSSCLILQATGHLKWMDFIFDPKFQFMALGTAAISAFTEELIFRGYILGNLLESFPKWLALLIATLVFAIFHFTIAGFFPLVNVLLLGLITGLFYMYTQNLWFPVCFHWVWIYMTDSVLGLGNNPAAQSFLQSTRMGDENITGGSTGLQGSFILMAMALVSAITLFLILQKKFKLQSPPVPGRI
jgi:membrane protease YdiL (CAAX protease family)